MGAFRSSIPRLMWLYLVAACFLFLVPNTGYQVSAVENDADLVFENNVEESKLVSDDNKHTIERRDTSHHTNHLNSKSSQPVEDEHWLTTAVKRLKRQWDIGSWFSTPEEEEEKKEDSRERRASGEEGQQVGQQTDDDFDNDIEDEDDEEVVEELIPQSHKEDLQGEYGPDDSYRTDDDEDDFGDLSSGEGSAAIPSTELPRETHVVPGQPIYYRITMTVLEPFIEAFNDRNSHQYKEISSNLVKAVDELYEDLDGQQSATVIKIQKREADVFSSKVTMDLGTVDFYDHGRVRSHLLSHIRNYHTLGPYQVSDEDFTFRQFEGGSSLPNCGPNELPCHSGECVPVSARCDGKVDCRDQSDEAGCEYNINEVDLRPAPELPTSTRPPSYDSRPHIPELFPTRFDETNRVHETATSPNVFSTIFDSLFNQTSGLDDVSDEVTTTQRPWYIPAPLPTSTEPPYRPVLPFEPTSEEPTTFRHPYPYTPSPSRCRADDVIRCADGSSICADQKCDGRQDCPDGDDEWNCHACAEGELSCDISRCVPLSKRCDGINDCDDRTDELECGESF